MKFLLFGTGDYYNRYKIWFDKEDIIALIDNSKEKQGHFIDDILVISPRDISRYEYDAIIILSFYVRTMKEQLLELGVEENKIYHFFDLHKLSNHLSKKRRIRYYGVLPVDESADTIRRVDHVILLLSQDLTLGGPALALYHAAQILVKRGYQIVYGSMMDGPLREILMQEGIPVVIDENLMIQTMKETDWVNEYACIICNTMNFHIFLLERDVRIPVAWWLHDGLFFYDGVSRKVMDKLVTDNMKIWSVGPIPARAVKTFRPDFQVQDLLYGVTDQRKKDIGSSANDIELTSGQDRRIRFTTIGYIEYRKGQDILFAAIRNLKSDIRRRAEFYFVGQNTSLMAKNIINASRDIPEVIVTGLVDRERIDSILEETDILVCPSREDPMPTVAAEAMMHGVPCLVSDATGTAEYVRDGIDGMVFRCEDIEQLKKILEQCVQKKFDLKQMGKNARRVYEQYFSMEAFESHFVNLVEEIP